MAMETWYANVRTGIGVFIRVSVQAETFYAAQQMLKAQYGDKLISQPYRM